VPVSYVVLDGKIAFWADNVSQKMVNLQSDGRVSVVVDDGVDFQELRGVQVTGTASLHDDAATNERIADLFARKAPEEHRDAATLDAALDSVHLAERRRGFDPHAALSFVLGVEAELQQCIGVLAANHDDVAAAAAIATAGSAARDELLPAEGKATVTAVAGLYENSDFINKHRKAAGVHFCRRLIGTFRRVKRWPGC